MHIIIIELGNYACYTDVCFNFWLDFSIFLFVKELTMWLVMSQSLMVWFFLVICNLFLGTSVQKPLLAFRMCSNVGKTIMIDLRKPCYCSYQNYLSKETSDLLLSILKPVSFFCNFRRLRLTYSHYLLGSIPLQVLVLSGHDHDQCTVVHSTPFGPVTEVRESQLSAIPCFMFCT